MNMKKIPHVVSLLSGGLDSILAAKVLERQGVGVTCLHFYTPFFGAPSKVAHWEEVYGITIRAVDIGEAYVQMLVNRPVYGFGKVLNPCVDCKILMLTHARSIMEELGACAIATGEVLGQRPMSQRRDTLNVIQRDANIKGLLLRPLTALHLDPCKAELDGLIDRSQLLGFSGRGRKSQMNLAKELGLKEIPTPAGGCRLAEKENARNYWNILRYVQQPKASDFYLSNTGRQFWSEGSSVYWLVMGRNQSDNDAIMNLANPNDVLLKLQDFTGPIALLRGGADEHGLRKAAELTASYSPKAVRQWEENGGSIAMRLHKGTLDSEGSVLDVSPLRSSDFWKESKWPDIKESIREETRIAANQP